MKRFTYLAILLLLPASNLHAQTPDADSLTVVSKAQNDANNFKLNKIDLKQFRKHRDAYMLQFSPNRNPLSGPPNVLKTPVNPAGMRKVREGYNQIDYTSDYFKPSQSTTKDTTLLRDSTYVKAFRVAAYKSTIAMRTAGHYVAIWGGVAVGIFLIIGFIIIANSMG